MASPSPIARFDDRKTDEGREAVEGVEALFDPDSEGYESELESMTGKGIKRLCLELLELKKASDEDFKRNIYSNYPAFLRIFEEVGGIESEIIKLKEHVSTQKFLVKELLNSTHLQIISDNLDDSKDAIVEDLDLDFPSWLETRMQNILETLDILFSENQLEEALVLLKKETQALQKLQKENDFLLPIISPFARAISDWKSRLAHQFTSLAEHKRVTWPELHKALSGLCKLGESHRANILLLNFFHLQLENSVHELKCSKTLSHGTHLLVLVKTVFSILFQAARSSVVLFGEASPYTLDIMQWARLELEVVCNSFDAHLKSISDSSLALAFAAEIMKISVSFCSVLENKGLVLQPDFFKLVKPYLEDILQMHVNHLKKVVSQFAATDTWFLGEFLFAGILKDTSSSPVTNGRLGYCLLTSSGRKFITLIQSILDDSLPLRALHIDSLILIGLTDLFDEYMFALEKSMKREDVVECNFPRIVSDVKLRKHISILVNSSVLMHLLPTIVRDSFNGTTEQNNVQLAELDQLSSPKELDMWKRSIEESYDRLKNCFCQHFVSDVLYLGDFESFNGLDSCSCGHCIPGSSKDPMPSFAFQELCLGLQQLEEYFKFISNDEDGMLNSLLNEILRIVICWVSDHLEFLKNSKTYAQLLLDIHFLMELARVGEYFSDDLLIAALDLTQTMKTVLSMTDQNFNREIPYEKWASNAAKLAIKILHDRKVAGAEATYDAEVSCGNNYTEVNHEGKEEEEEDDEEGNEEKEEEEEEDDVKVEEAVLEEEEEEEEEDGDDHDVKEEEEVVEVEEDEEGAYYVNGVKVLSTSVESLFTADDELINSWDDFTGAMVIENKIPQILENPITCALGCSCDDERPGSLNIYYFETENKSKGVSLSDTMDIGDPDVEDDIVIAEEESGQQEASNPAYMALSDNLEIQLLGTSKNLVVADSEQREVNSCITNLVHSDGKILAQEDEFSSDSLVELATMQTMGMVDLTETTDACLLSATVKSKAAGEFSSIGAPYSKDMLPAKEVFQHNSDRSEAQDEADTSQMHNFKEKPLAGQDMDLFPQRDGFDPNSGHRRLSLETNDGQDRIKHGKGLERFKHAKASERFKNVQASDGLGRNIMGKPSRPKWQ